MTYKKPDEEPITYEQQLTNHQKLVDELGVRGMANVNDDSQQFANDRQNYYAHASADAQKNVEDAKLKDAFVDLKPYTQGAKINGINTRLEVPGTKSTAPTVDEMMRNAYGSAYLMSPEEEESRVRKANAVGNVYHLSRALGALANSYFTGKGADSVQLDRTQLPDAMAFQNRVEQSRRAAQQDALSIQRQKAEQEYRNAQLKNSQEETAMKKGVYEAQARSYDSLAKERNANAEATVQKALREEGLSEARINKIIDDMRHNRVMEGVAQQNAATNQARVNNRGGNNQNRSYTETRTSVDPLTGKEKTTTVVRQYNGNDASTSGNSNRSSSGNGNGSSSGNSNRSENSDRGSGTSGGSTGSWGNSINRHNRVNNGRR